MTYLLVSLAASAVVSSVLAWYYRSQAQVERAKAEAAQAAVGVLRSVNVELRASLSRALAKVAARLKQEAQDDARTAADAGTDAGLAASLLNSLRPHDPGPG